jgi:hypothetical protein
LSPQRLLHFEDVGRQLGLKVIQVERLVEQGRLRSVASLKKESVRWIDTLSFRKLKREIERMQPALEAAVELGIGLNQLSDLTRHELLLPDSGPEIDGCDETKFSRKTLDEFLDRISGIITPPRKAGEYSVVPLGRVADHLGLHKLSFGQFIKAMFDGFPRPVVEREGLPVRLSRFWFRIDEINQYIDSQLPPDERPAAVHYVLPALDKVVAWLDRKHWEADNRFYRSNRQSHISYATDPLRRIMSRYVRTGSEG